MALLAFGWLVIAVPGMFITEHIEFTLENILVFTLFGFLSLGLWGLAVFVVGAIPIAFAVWVHNSIMRKRQTEHGVAP